MSWLNRRVPLPNLHPSTSDQFQWNCAQSLQALQESSSGVPRRDRRREEGPGSQVEQREREEQK